MTTSASYKGERNFYDLGNPVGRARYREFKTLIGMDEVERRGGLGVTLDAVIEDHQRSFRETHRHNDHARSRGHDSPTPAELNADSEDLVVVEGDRVRAVLVPDPGGKAEYVVTRFPDRPKYERRCSTEEEGGDDEAEE